MGKRSNGEGTLRHRKDGRWEGRLTVGRNPNGSLKKKVFYGKTQKEVKRKIEEYRDKKKNALRTEEEYTFAEYGQKWLRDHSRNISIATQENYKYALDQLCLLIGNKKLSSFRTDDIEDTLYILRKKRLSDSYLTKCKAVMNQIFRKAVANDIIGKNPVSYTEKQRLSDDPTKKDAFHKDEIKKMMEQLPHDQWGEGIRLMLGTGMRTQELLALEPRHIAEDGSVITIDQAVVMEKGRGVIGPPKTKYSKRKIPVPSCLWECAKKLRDTERTFVFAGTNPGAPCNPTTFRGHYYKELKQVGGVRLLSPHCCRHTYVSQLQAAEVDGATIKDLVGHSDIEMTLHYLHIQPGIFEDAAEKLNKILIAAE